MADIRYDAALAAALTILDLIGQSPGDGNAALVSGITFTILHSIYESERLLREARTGHPSPN